MSIRRFARAVLESALACAALLVCGAGLLVWSAVHPLPSDEQMRDRWHAHRADFDSLRALVNDDRHLTEVIRSMNGVTFVNHVTGVVRHAPDLAIGMSMERWREHHRLMRELGVKMGIARGEGGRVTLWIAERGLVVGEVRKGYVWSPEPLSPVWTSLDEAADAKADVAYRPLGGGWWLVVMREDETG